MKKTRQRYDGVFKKSVVSELENKTDVVGRYMTIQVVLSDGFALSISKSCQALGSKSQRLLQMADAAGKGPIYEYRSKKPDSIDRTGITGYGNRRMTAELQFDSNYLCLCTSPSWDAVCLQRPHSVIACNF
ncbi:MAG: hypothetical protein WCP70_14885 [Methanothrix sp.]